MTVGLDSAAPPWAKGYDVADLKLIGRLFKQHDAGHLHGAFDRFSETSIADALARGVLALGPRDEQGVPLWALVSRTLTRKASVTDFAGQKHALPLGGLYVSRLAYQGEVGEAPWDAVRAPLAGAGAVEVWQEHPGERALVEGLRCGPVKIKASSSMRGVWLAPDLPWEGYPPRQAVGLGRLPLALPQPSLQALAEHEAVRDAARFADHYSSYNVGGSWSALALRGFYDDPLRIEKPREMNRKWKAEHAAELDREPRDTPLRAELPDVEAVLQAIPAAWLDRVRLMRLEPGGGELQRHADITDPDAGVEEGQVVRLHIPLLTNPQVEFRSWDLDGKQHKLWMEEGSAWYLDTRKPHTALNGGSEPRVHLVVDAGVSPALRALLDDVEEAPASLVP